MGVWKVGKQADGEMELPATPGAPRSRGEKGKG